MAVLTKKLNIMSDIYIIYGSKIYSNTKRKDKESWNTLLCAWIILLEIDCSYSKYTFYILNTIADSIQQIKIIFNIWR